MKKILILVFLGGCAVGPNYQSIVDVPCEESWVYPEDSALGICCEEPECDWWRRFDDPMLNTYIEMAACYNNNLLTAESNILIARAMKCEKLSNFFPQIDADVGISRYGYSRTGPLFYIEQFSKIGPFAPLIRIPFYQTLYNALFDASWEIDLFGKTARSVEAAERGLESAVENYRDVLVSLLAETASNYIEVRGAQAQLQLTKENVDYLQKNLSLVEDRYKNGLSNALDLALAQANLEEQEANIPLYEGQIYGGIFSLSVLTGQDPEALLCEMLPCKPLPHFVEEVCVGLKSDLLLRRPDVRRAERNLAQAVAQIGIAQASFFPSFSFSGTAGLQSLQLRKLFEAQSFQWSYGFDFNFPIFHGGYLMAQYRAAECNAQEVALQYHQTVLEALKDAESALVSYAEDLEALDALENAVGNFQTVRDLTWSQYQNGYVNLMSYYDRENDLIRAKLTCLQREIETLIDLVALYKSLGGGWQCSGD